MGGQRPVHLQPRDTPLELRESSRDQKQPLSPPVYDWLKEMWLASPRVAWLAEDESFMYTVSNSCAKGRL
jgi:hypothetical protein